MKIWPSPAIGRLRTLWEAGHSTSLIAEHLNREFGMSVTRNAVIGKTHRLQLPRRTVLTKRQSPKPLRRLMVISPHKITQVVISAVRKRRNRFKLFDLTDNCCHWPVTNDKPYFFCGAATQNNETYCPEHGARAWQKKSK